MPRMTWLRKVWKYKEVLCDIEHNRQVFFGVAYPSEGQPQKEHKEHNIKAQLLG
jgi:hypothetical protein